MKISLSRPQCWHPWVNWNRLPSKKQATNAKNSLHEPISILCSIMLHLDFVPGMAKWIYIHCILIAIYVWHHCSLQIFYFRWHCCGSSAPVQCGQFYCNFTLDTAMSIGGRRCCSHKTMWIQITSCVLPLIRQQSCKQMIGQTFDRTNVHSTTCT